MKKTFAVATAAVCVAVALSFGACTGSEEPEGGKTPTSVTLQVYAPDGAPALALANLIESEESAKATSDNSPAYAYNYDIRIVDASTIVSYVTGESPKADLCILPLNEASLLLGTGKTYRMAGTVTNGNMYFLTAGSNPALTEDNFSSLVGKKVGVVQLRNVPGLTLRATLKDHNIPFGVLQSAQENADASKVNLVPFAPDDVNPGAGCDYYLVPEPAASAKIKGTAAMENPFTMAGDLQALYGEGGYPQAVLVVKDSVIANHPGAVDEVTIKLEGCENYLKNAEPSKLVKLLADKRTEGLKPAFNLNNLTKEVVARCSVRYTPAQDCKAAVMAFLEKLIAIDGESAMMPANEFFL